MSEDEYRNPIIKLLRLLAEAEEKIERHERALQEIVNWSEAYPLGAFPELNEAEWTLAAQVLSEYGLTLDRISASNMRHVIVQAGAIARKALKPK